MLVRFNIIIFLLLILGFTLAGIISFEVSWGKYTIEDLNTLMMKHTGVGFDIVFAILSGLVFLFFTLKIVKRWLAALNLTQNKRSYLYLEPIDKPGLSRIWTYNILEAIIYITIGGSVYFLTDYALVLAVICFLMALELFVFHFSMKHAYKLGLGPQGIVLLTRDLTLIPMKNLTKVEKDFYEYYFTYRDKGVKKIPLIYLSDVQRKKLISSIGDLTSKDNVFFSDNLKS